MKNTRKPYEVPVLKVLRLNASLLLASSKEINVEQGEAGERGESKAFWGATLFDDEKEVE